MATGAYLGEQPAIPDYDPLVFYDDHITYIPSCV